MISLHRSPYSIPAARASFGRRLAAVIPCLLYTSGKLECLGVFGDDYDPPDGTGVRDYIHVVDPVSYTHLDVYKRQSGYFMTRPKGFEEAAYIDGCGHFKTMTKIMIPMAKPSIITVILFNFLVVNGAMNKIPTIMC